MRESDDVSDDRIAYQQRYYRNNKNSCSNECDHQSYGLPSDEILWDASKKMPSLASFVDMDSFEGKTTEFLNEKEAANDKDIPVVIRVVLFIILVCHQMFTYNIGNRYLLPKVIKFVRLVLSAFRFIQGSNYTPTVKDRDRANIMYQQLQNDFSAEKIIFLHFSKVTP